MELKRPYLFGRVGGRGSRDPPQNLPQVGQLFGHRGEILGNLRDLALTQVQGLQVRVLLGEICGQGFWGQALKPRPDCRIKCLADLFEENKVLVHRMVIFWVQSEAKVGQESHLSNVEQIIGVAQVHNALKH